VYITASLLVVTKLCDVVTTLQEIEHSTEETNPIARCLMARLGTGHAVWAIFLLSLVIIGLSSFAAVTSGLLMQVLFVIVGGLIAVVQASVAHCNWSGRGNLVTRAVRILHARFKF
jgi:fatty acid desaturase